MIELDKLVAGPGFAPHSWQSKCPDPARDGGSKVPVAPSPDLTRIVALPRRDQPTSEQEDQLVKFMTAQFERANDVCRCDELFREYGMVDPVTKKTPDCIKTLRPVQAWALLEIRTKSGLLGPIGVGHGKTILDLLAPLAMPNCRVAVLLVPPGLVKQIIRDYKIVGQHFRMPSLIIHDRQAETAIIPGEPALHVFPYSRLSRPEHSDYLENVLKPDTIIADEVHKLKAADTATTGRVLRYFKLHRDTRFCGWSGSLTDKSIKDYAHLAALALRLGSPLPIDPEVVDDWARAIDPSDAAAPEGALDQLCKPGEHIHSAFHRRLVETPGLVATKQASVSSELLIEVKTAPRIPDKPTLYEMSLVDALRQVRDEWIRPDGEELADALSRSRCAIELSCGFFYRWRFPFVHGKPQNIADILRWLEARKEWNREVRYAIRSRKEHFDSERLARNAAERAWGDRPINDKSLPVWYAQYYPAWRDVEKLVVYETEPVWVDEFLAQDAADWAEDNRGIVWYSHAAFGQKVADLSGLPLHAGGSNAGKLIARATGETSIICSIKSHGTGRDGLQFKYSDQLVANPGSSNEEWEQLLGRLHRVGQQSQSVRTLFYRHTPELARCVNQALKRSGYVHATIGADQKLVMSGLTATNSDDNDDAE